MTGDLRGVLWGGAERRPFAFDSADPHPTLAPFVARYWFVEWDQRGLAPYPQHVLPHPSVNITFKRGRCRIAGVTRGRFTEVLDDTYRVLGLRFRPGGFRPFLDRPVASITDLFLPLSEVFGEAAEELERTVVARSTFAEMAEAAERFLLPRVPAPDPMVDRADEAVRLVASDPTISQVRELADRLEYRPRALQRLFHDYVGVGPKWVIRLYRLHEATRQAEGGREVDWAELAYRLGYADQAHFTRDFTALVGTSPTRYAEETDPSR